VILTDREIKMALERETLIIDPRPDERAFASTSVDLTLDSAFSDFRQPNKGIEITIDPALDNFDHDSAMEQITERHVISSEGYALVPRNSSSGGPQNTLIYETTPAWLPALKVRVL
jgi:dCTP deaminase